MMGRSGALIFQTDDSSSSKKLREGNPHTFRPHDFGFAFGDECGDRKSHGDAVIPMRVETRAMELRCVCGWSDRLRALRPPAHRAQVLNGRADAVGLLDAKLPGVANREATEHYCEPRTASTGQLVN